MAKELPIVRRETRKRSKKGERTIENGATHFAGRKGSPVHDRKLRIEVSKLLSISQGDRFVAHAFSWVRQADGRFCAQPESAFLHEDGLCGIGREGTFWIEREACDLSLGLDL